MLTLAAVAVVVAALLLVALVAGVSRPQPVPVRSDRPLGPSGTWTLRFADEFNGTAVDWTRWTDRSSAEADGGRGNKQHRQLEWNQGKNCSVGNGVLTITAKPDDITSPSGTHYAWSSCLLSSAPSFAFRYGYLEARARFPAARGFWPGFWTWQTAGNRRWTETDVYEYYTDTRNRIYVTQHSGSGGGCTLSDVGFDPSASFHTYGADIAPTGTRFYVDGRLMCTASGTSTGRTNVLLDLFVYAVVPPVPGTVGRHRIDYVRVWQRP